MKKLKLIDVLSQVENNEIYFGPQGFLIATTASEVEDAQVGFAVDADGAALSGEGLAGWQSSWVVIAQDTELGDPYFVDINNDKMAVYTAIYGEAGWETELVASSLTNFLLCLALLVENSSQQGPQFVPDETSFTDLSQLALLQQRLIETSASETFWKMFFECYLDWLKDEDC